MKHDLILFLVLWVGLIQCCKTSAVNITVSCDMYAEEATWALYEAADNGGWMLHGDEGYRGFEHSYQQYTLYLLLEDGAYMVHRRDDYGDGGVAIEIVDDATGDLLLSSSADSYAATRQDIFVIGASPAGMRFFILHVLVNAYPDEASYNLFRISDETGSETPYFTDDQTFSFTHESHTNAVLLKVGMWELRRHDTFGDGGLYARLEDFTTETIIFEADMYEYSFEGVTSFFVEDVAAGYGDVWLSLDCSVLCDTASWNLYYFDELFEGWTAHFPSPRSLFPTSDGTYTYNQTIELKQGVWRLERTEDFGAGVMEGFVLTLESQREVVLRGDYRATSWDRFVVGPTLPPSFVEVRFYPPSPHGGWNLRHLATSTYLYPEKQLLGSDKPVAIVLYLERGDWEVTVVGLHVGSIIDLGIVDVASGQLYFRVRENVTSPVVSYHASVGNDTEVVAPTTPSSETVYATSTPETIASAATLATSPVGGSETNGTEWGMITIFVQGDRWYQESSWDIFRLDEAAGGESDSTGKEGDFVPYSVFAQPQTLTEEFEERELNLTLPSGAYQLCRFDTARDGGLEIRVTYKNIPLYNYTSTFMDMSCERLSFPVGRSRFAKIYLEAEQGVGTRYWDMHYYNEETDEWHMYYETQDIFFDDLPARNVLLEYGLWQFCRYSVYYEGGLKVTVTDHMSGETILETHHSDYTDSSCRFFYIKEPSFLEELVVLEYVCGLSPSSSIMLRGVAANSSGLWDTHIPPQQCSDKVVYYEDSGQKQQPVEYTSLNYTARVLYPGVYDVFRQHPASQGSIYNYGGRDMYGVGEVDDQGEGEIRFRAWSVNGVYAGGARMFSGNDSTLFVIGERENARWVLLSVECTSGLDMWVILHANSSEVTFGPHACDPNIHTGGAVYQVELTAGSYVLRRLQGESDGAVSVTVVATGEQLVSGEVSADGILQDFIFDVDVMEAEHPLAAHVRPKSCASAGYSCLNGGKCVFVSMNSTEYGYEADDGTFSDGSSSSGSSDSNGAPVEGETLAGMWRCDCRSAGGNSQSFPAGFSGSYGGEGSGEGEWGYENERLIRYLGVRCEIVVDVAETAVVVVTAAEDIRPATTNQRSGESNINYDGGSRGNCTVWQPDMDDPSLKKDTGCSLRSALSLVLDEMFARNVSGLVVIRSDDTPVLYIDYSLGSIQLGREFFYVPVNLTVVGSPGAPAADSLPSPAKVTRFSSYSSEPSMSSTLPSTSFSAASTLGLLSNATLVSQVLGARLPSVVRGRPVIDANFQRSILQVDVPLDMLYIESLVLVHGWSSESGGCLSTRFGSLRAENTIFWGCTMIGTDSMTGGGAVAGPTQSTLSVPRAPTGSYLYDVTFRRCLLAHNIVTVPDNFLMSTQPKGTGAFLVGGGLVISETVVMHHWGCSAAVSGSAIILNVRDSVFASNWNAATAQAGALDLIWYDEVQELETVNYLERVLFFRNFGGNGGAIYTTGWSTFVECVFEENVAVVGGSVSSFAGFVMENITMMTNRASCGGALFLDFSNAYVRSSLFYGNSASRASVPLLCAGCFVDPLCDPLNLGGAVYHHGATLRDGLSQDRTFMLRIEGSIFQGNTAHDPAMNALYHASVVDVIFEDTYVLESPQTGGDVAVAGCDDVIDVTLATPCHKQECIDLSDEYGLGLRGVRCDCRGRTCELINMIFFSHDFDSTLVAEAHKTPEVIAAGVETGVWASVEGCGALFWRAETESQQLRTSVSPSHDSHVLMECSGQECVRFELRIKFDVGGANLTEGVYIAGLVVFEDAYNDVTTAAQSLTHTLELELHLYTPPSHFSKVVEVRSQATQGDPFAEQAHYTVLDLTNLVVTSGDRVGIILSLHDHEDFPLSVSGYVDLIRAELVSVSTGEVLSTTIVREYEVKGSVTISFEAPTRPFVAMIAVYSLEGAVDWIDNTTALSFYVVCRDNEIWEGDECTQLPSEQHTMIALEAVVIAVSVSLLLAGTTYFVVRRNARNVMDMLNKFLKEIFLVCVGIMGELFDLGTDVAAFFYVYTDDDLAQYHALYLAVVTISLSVSLVSLSVNVFVLYHIVRASKTVHPSFPSGGSGDSKGRTLRQPSISEVSVRERQQSLVVGDGEQPLVRRPSGFSYPEISRPNPSTRLPPIVQAPTITSPPPSQDIVVVNSRNSWYGEKGKDGAEAHVRKPGWGPVGNRSPVCTEKEGTVSPAKEPSSWQAADSPVVPSGTSRLQRHRTSTIARASAEDGLLRTWDRLNHRESQTCLSAERQRIRRDLLRNYMKLAVLVIEDLPMLTLNTWVSWSTADSTDTSLETRFFVLMAQLVTCIMIGVKLHALPAIRQLRNELRHL
eukprot:Rmarinus@m.25571